MGVPTTQPPNGGAGAGQAYMNNAPPPAMGQMPAYQQNQYYPPQTVPGGGEWKPPVVAGGAPAQPWKPVDQYGNSREVQTTVTPMGPPSPNPHYPGPQEVMGSPVNIPVEMPAHAK
jgi:hypothetical protein